MSMSLRVLVIPINSVPATHGNKESIRRLKMASAMENWKIFRLILKRKFDTFLSLLKSSKKEMRIRCLVSDASDVIHEVLLHQKAKGQNCLDQVCQQLGILEVDYFGLQYEGNKGEQLWLNMRNRLNQQLNRQPPYRLLLKVKFFVPPHSLLQNTTRHQFSLQVIKDLMSQKLQVSDKTTCINICALLAQLSKLDQNPVTEFTESIYTTLVEKIGGGLALANEVAEQHTGISTLNPAQAEYKLLQEVAELPNYGISFHEAKNCSGENVHIGVGPEGITIFDENLIQVETVDFHMMQKATLADRVVFVQLINQATEEDSRTVGFKLVSEKAAKALYRCMTETHSFYRCDTVRSIVATQYCRDLKGTFVSLFNENTSLGKTYIFDIKRTSQEVHDHVRRKLYKMSNDIETETNSTATNMSNEPEENEVSSLRNTVQTVKDSLTCRICMNANISTVLCPCGHLVCCRVCAPHIKECPLCREKIIRIQKIYLPFDNFTANNSDEDS
ncbi:E3 ubiquitin-protein ligase MYLIP isoform X2 [Octopus bimaculoides]|uniref:E3 ubiquitin-protein ligase MYLIP isoform X2 n=1 Tax=Octopus bimaculoides TaxID=37653 RepID=UPI00071CAEFC|nr:E3 ubiquitin-protein ligase MYLIP isoform X2 [Octopus bimaculoides]|eukprot:XP_014768786.1 PREDICTED: E3 ubiquitin-protein ligase MYLIP-like isoform X2 [Octopus bimaculoides]